MFNSHYNQPASSTVAYKFPIACQKKGQKVTVFCVLNWERLNLLNWKNPKKAGP